MAAASVVSNRQETRAQGDSSVAGGETVDRAVEHYWHTDVVRQRIDLLFRALKSDRMRVVKLETAAFCVDEKCENFKHCRDGKYFDVRGN